MIFPYLLRLQTINKIYEFPESFIKMWNFMKGVNPPIKERKTEDKTLYYSEYVLKANPAF
jgi:hypothetical protein